jgi:hypothetical protein
VTERPILLSVIAAALATTSAQAGEAAGPDVSEVIVTGRGGDLNGVADSANQGQVSAADIALRPLLRPGEIVEQIPGVIITQHSGSGKANQYFLRGFNLDHGTDLAVSVDGMPVNMPSHAHGQGYADLNFLIPDLVETVDYEKGPYYTDVGDFGSAGAFQIHYMDRTPGGMLRLEGGETGYGRGLLADTFDLGATRLLFGGEIEHNDGPWTKGDNERKLSGIARWSGGDAANGWSLTALAYHNAWNSTDQIPDRAIAGQADPVGAPAAPAAALVSRFGQIDPSDGGLTSRYSLSGDWRRTNGNSRQEVSFYGFYYDLNLFSDFTYFLEDPVHGDQIEQQDTRYVFGGQATQTWSDLFAGTSEATVGLQERTDLIHNGLYHTEDRVRLDPRAVSRIDETTLSPYAEVRTHWTPWFRTVIGVRADALWMDVDERTAAHTGHVDAQVVTPKINLIFGPWAKTEFYLDYGQGFHSNDARGVTSAVDPATALPKSAGEEIGIRTTILPHLRSELSLWQLDLKSELVWDGDEGTNVPSGPTRRYGVEFANWWTPTPWLTLDADYAWSHARFTDVEPGGPYVPEALVSTFDGGVAVHDLPGALERWSAGLRLRYFGPRPLTQDDTIRSKATTLVYADLGYRVSERISVGASVFNVLGAKSSDIDYFYTSRLPGEPLAGVDDIHTHPSEPREVRLFISATF